MKNNSTNNARIIYEYTKFLKEAKRLDCLLYTSDAADE